VKALAGSKLEDEDEKADQGEEVGESRIYWKRQSANNTKIIVQIAERRTVDPNRTEARGGCALRAWVFSWEETPLSLGHHWSRSEPTDSMALVGEKGGPTRTLHC